MKKALLILLMTASAQAFSQISGSVPPSVLTGELGNFRYWSQVETSFVMTYGECAKINASKERLDVLQVTNVLRLRVLKESEFVPDCEKKDPIIACLMNDKNIAKIEMIATDDFAKHLVHKAVSKDEAMKLVEFYRGLLKLQKK